MTHCGYTRPDYNITLASWSYRYAVWEHSDDEKNKLVKKFCLQSLCRLAAALLLVGPIQTDAARFLIRQMSGLVDMI